MLDVFYAINGRSKDRPTDPKYNFEMAITETVEVVSDKRPAELTVVYAPWHIDPRDINRIGKTCLARGSSTLLFNFHQDILSPNSQSVSDSFHYIAETTSEKTNAYVEKGNYAKVHMTAYSLGNVMMSMALDRLKRFDDITMVVPGTDLTTGLWYGLRTQNLRRQLQQKGYTFEQLSEDWADLAPLAHIEAMRGHPLKIILAARDRFIPYRFGRAFAYAIEDADIPFELIIQKNHGHIWTAARHIRST